jgi:hypothetical protein
MMPAIAYCAAISKHASRFATALHNLQGIKKKRGATPQNKSGGSAAASARNRIATSAVAYLMA